MTTPVSTFEVLTGYNPDTGQVYKLEVVRSLDSGRVQYAWLQTRQTATDAWSPRCLLEHLSWEDGGPVPAGVA